MAKNRRNDDILDIIVLVIILTWVGFSYITDKYPEFTNEVNNLFSNTLHIGE